MALDGTYRQRCPQQAAFYHCLEDPWPEFKESDPYFYEKVPGLLRPMVEETVQRLPDRGLFRHGLALAVCDSAALYHPRHPEESVLYGVVAAQLETFLDRQRQREHTVPRFVERELRSFLECGVLAHGFLRVHCEDCGRDRVVAFSCYPQRETICSSKAASDGERREYGRMGG